MSFNGTHLAKFNETEECQSSMLDSNLRTISSQVTYQDILARFKAYRPRSNIIDIHALNASQYLKIKKYKEAAYYGEIVNNKRQGQGVMLYGNDRVYEGEWAGDYKNGRGYEQQANGCVYQGHFVNGKPEGIGKYQWPNGQFYEGEWLSGLKHGSGMWKGAKGDSYVGEWKFGKADGYGVHVWINGDRYEGQFKQCLKHGQGIQRFANGDIYKGDFVKGKTQGYGEYYWTNRCYYKGNFNQGKRQGHGIWKKSSGSSDKYEGEYLQDKKSGYGIFTWAMGNVYKGNYLNDERQGYGQMYWIDGSYYKGQWKSGRQEGQGIIYSPEMGIKKGIFMNNELVEITIEEEPVINVPINLRRKKLKTKMKSRSVSNRLIYSRKSVVPMTSKLKQHAPAEIADKMIRNHVARSKNYSSRAYSQNSSYRVLAGSPKKSQDFKSFVFKAKNSPQIASKCLSPIQQYRKQHMPHSSVYMHKIQKRMAALGQSAQPQLQRKIQTNHSHYQNTQFSLYDSGKLLQSN